MKLILKGKRGAGRKLTAEVPLAVDSDANGDTIKLLSSPTDVTVRFDSATPISGAFYAGKFRVSDGAGGTTDLGPCRILYVS